MTAPDEWMTDAVMRVLGHAAFDEMGEAATWVDRIATERGTAGMFSLCYAMAQVVMQFGVGAETPGVGFTAPALIGRDGRQIAPEDAPPEARPAAWAARFVAAYANKDSATTNALFYADVDEDTEESAERHGSNIAALIALAAGVLATKVGDGRD
jgi:hypothetical protein